jgi:hypothetical protein
MHRGVADSVPELLKTEEDVAERAVVGEEFNLTRTIKDNVVVYILKLAVVTIFNINTSLYLRALSGPSPATQSCAPALREHREHPRLGLTLLHP